MFPLEPIKFTETRERSTNPIELKSGGLSEGGACRESLVAVRRCTLWNKVRLGRKGMQSYERWDSVDLWDLILWV